MALSQKAVDTRTFPPLGPIGSGGKGGYTQGHKPRWHCASPKELLTPQAFPPRGPIGSGYTQGHKPSLLKHIRCVKLLLACVWDATVSGMPCKEQAKETMAECTATSHMLS